MSSNRKATMICEMSMCIIIIIIIIIIIKAIYIAQDC